MAEQLERKNIFIFFQNDIFNKALRCRDTQYNATFDAVQATTTSSIKKLQFCSKSVAYSNLVF